MSEYSSVRCIPCGAVGRTKASYVDLLYSAGKVGRDGRAQASSE